MQNIIDELTELAINQVLTEFGDAPMELYFLQQAVKYQVLIKKTNKISLNDKHYKLLYEQLKNTNDCIAKILEEVKE